MAAVSLHIVEPANGTVYAAATNVRFRGAVDGTPPAPLFFGWYSSLAIPPAPPPPAPPPTKPGDPFATALDQTLLVGRAGSYVISFAARDVQSGAPADLTRVRNGGVTGGPQGPTACVIHVLIAEIAAPAPGAAIPRAGLALVARAPLLWGDLKGPAYGPTRTKNPQYDAIDRVQYRWKLAPLGAPAGRPSMDFIPANPLFDPNDATAKGPVLRSDVPAPGSLGLGAYRITLRVQDKNDTAAGSEATCDVTFNA